MATRPPPYDEFYGQHCPSALACPHLQGQNVQALWQQNQQLIGENRQVPERNDRLVKELHDAHLRCAQVEAHHRRQFKANRDAQNQSNESHTSRGRRRRRRGAPKGHPPWRRPPPQRVDRTVAVPRPTTCPHCHSPDLPPHPEDHRHRQEDIVLVPRTVVTEYRHDPSWCARCQRPVHQTGPGEMRHAAIGPVAKATAAWLRYDVGLSYRKIQRLFDQLCGLRFVPASALGFDRQLTRRAQDLYADLRAKIHAADCLHAAETHWRVDGRNHFLWYAGNEQLSCYHLAPHRSAEVATGLLG